MARGSHSTDAASRVGESSLRERELGGPKRSQGLAPSGARRAEARFLGRVSYASAERLQSQIRDAVLEGTGSEALLLLEHDPVITLGRSAERSDILATDHWLAERGIEIAECDRGGQVTYHGPGQLVGYPVLDLKPDRRDVRRYVRDLQEVLIRSLREFGVTAHPSPQPEKIGVWVGERKIASIGVHLRRWVTTHGFALNVATELDHFGAIVPCGLSSVRMTSIEEMTGQTASLAAVGRVVTEAFADVFDRELAVSGL